MNTPHIDPLYGESDVPVKDAATFLLLRESDSGVEVFTIRRAATMVFAGGIVAFPGGGVDATDREVVPTAGPSAAEWGTRLGVPDERAMSIVTAAVRECFEETGMLLARPRPDASSTAAPHGDGVLDLPSLTSWRRRLDAHEESLASFLGATRLVADTSRLKELSRWITPPGMPRRYDTFFFAVDVGDEHGPDGDSAEFDDSGWARPKDVLDARARGEVKLLPPTIVHLEELSEAGSVADYLYRPADMTPIRNDLRPKYRLDDPLP